MITLPTEPTEGEFVKSHPLFSFINIGQKGRICYTSSWNQTQDLLILSTLHYPIIGYMLPQMVLRR